jgi:phosphohistidine phosphatase
MKRLFIMRHAKSSWDDPRLADIDRPLNERGKRTAPFMGALMRRLNLLPDCIYTSSAKRAQKTARLAADGGAFEPELTVDERIYEASVNTLRQVLAATSSSCSAVMLVGHNPGLEDLIRYLTGAVEPMPTGAVAVIHLDLNDWSHLDAGTGVVNKVYRPRQEMPS